MVVVNYHDDLNELQGDAAATALVSAPHAFSPFERVEWWRNLAENCGLRPLIAVACKNEERVILPLARQGEFLVGLANWYSFRLAPLVTVGANPDTLLASLAADLARKASRILLEKVSADDAQLLASAFRDAGWTVLLEPCDTNHVLEVQGRDFATYLASRPGALRTTLRRKASKVDVQIDRRFDPQTYALYEEIYSESWKPEEGSPAFLRRFAEEEGAAGRLRLGLAFNEGRAVAAQLWTVERDTAFIHKLAHRQDAHKLSPGTVLSAALFKETIDRDRVELIDFGTGDDPYKRDWMELQRPRYRLDMLRPGIPRNWPLIARHGLRRLLGRV